MVVVRFLDRLTSAAGGKTGSAGLSERAAMRRTLAIYGLF
jgi:hypothetical protein